LVIKAAEKEVMPSGLQLPLVVIINTHMFITKAQQA